MKGVFHEYGDFRDKLGSLNSIGKPILFTNTSYIALTGKIANRVKINIKDFPAPINSKFDILIGKAIALYCADKDGEEDLYDYDELLFAGILKSDDFPIDN
mmetsp:Transcript_23401/g.23037  ORF Transcript_23401/g.23037 Transcript_23401/m.23037 type:complete len:101 (+) Transcript_23401:578-880(+)|eukprot:CAMPEP_0170559930 /NCGR_PEP_ID=MMETSP0211-20121228/45988_1 /TAXON_ID=311385 /ORGANISM="Pseudokeronopsis sp., Strain OXSARD2" /LENGTH=100 /DNA_ID=CAMNT_0010873575 /DNA_START=512 /DNA_END=814 /DNA_ORIENTATION=-